MKTVQTIIIFFLLFIVSTAYAQKNYKKGYVVLNSGDTLQGTIDYRNWDSRFDQITFYANKKEQKYEVKTIKCFFIEEVNETYRSYIGKIDNSRGQRQTYTTLKGFLNSEGITTYDTLFVRELIATKKLAFFIAKDKIGKVSFFVSKDNSIISPVLYHEFILNNEKGDLLYPVKLYKQQLLSYIGDCETINKELDRLEYTEEAMRKIFLYYTKCKNELAEIRERKETVAEKERKKSSFGVVGGLALNFFTFSGISEDYTYSVNPTPTFGLFIDAPIGRNLQRLSFNNQLMFYSFNVKKENSSIYYSITDRKGSYIKNNFLFKYKFAPLKKVNPFVKGGLTLGYQFLPLESATERNRTVSFGYLFGFGLNVKRTALFLTYDRNIVTENYVYFSEALHILSFSMSYSLFSPKNK